MHSETYDVAVIGAGISGLVAANYLAMNGLNVAIFEAQNKVGGYVSSFQRNDFTFDAGLTSFGNNGIVFPILKELQVDKTVEFTSIKRQLITDTFNVRVDLTIDGLKEEFQRIYPTEWEKLDKYFQLIQAVIGGLKTVFGEELLISDWKKVILTIIHTSRRSWPFIETAFSLRNKSKEDLHRQLFTDPELIQMLNSLGYPSMSALSFLGMWYSFLADYWYPLGGMQKLSNMLAEAFLQRGGKIYLGSRVERILLKPNFEAHALKGHSKWCVDRIQLEDDRMIKTPQVFANMDLRTTYLRLIGEEYLEPHFIEELSKVEPSRSMFSLFLGLKGKGFQHARRRIESSHCWFYLQGSAGEKFELSMQIPSLEDPQMAPLGESMIIWSFAEYKDWSAYNGRSTAYYRAKEAKAKELLTLVRREILPDLDERLALWEAATPLTYERYTGNFQGATAGRSWNPKKRVKLNWRKMSQITGLSVAGQWIYHPGGVPTAMLSARQEAQRLLKKIKLET